MTVRVELGIHSGRDPPAWSLGDVLGEELLRKLSELPPASSGAAGRSSPLGYRGVTAEWPGGIVELFGGQAILSDSRRTIHLVDAERAVERWLLETGRPVLDPAVLRHTPIG